MAKKHAALLLGLVAIGCASGQPWSDYHETPVIERGACATVIMPGEQVPLGSQPNCPGGYSSIGGAVVYDEKDYQKGKKPGQVARSALGLPAAVVGAPVAAGAAAVRRGSQSGQQAVSESGGTGAHEQDEIERIRREIVQRERVGTGQVAPPAPSPAPSPTPAMAASAASARGPSIADELAALRGERAAAQGASAAPAPPAVESAPPAEPLRAAAPSARSLPTAAPVADRVADRDGDGTPDHWVYRDASGRPVREQLDENGDGRPDRTAWLDPVTGRELRSEEDSNLDGRVDTWVEYADGAVARQRRDTNHDGIPDVWSYYGRDGKLSRQEQDLDGDGYRNRESLYRTGQLVKEREDRDGDGRFDLVTLYDEEERIKRRDEDRDGDGRIDTRSIYQGGKLVKREVVSEAIDDGDELSQTAW